MPTIVKQLKDNTAVYMAVMFLDAVATKQPKSVIPYDKEIIEGMGATENAESMFANVLVKLCIDKVRNLYLKINTHITRYVLHVHMDKGLRMEHERDGEERLRRDRKG